MGVLDDGDDGVARLPRPPRVSRVTFLMSHKSLSFFRGFMCKHTHYKRMSRVFAIAPYLSPFRQGLSLTLKLVFLLEQLAIKSW